MESYLVAYDISDAKRLRKVAQVCEDFGVRKQFSVFLCRITPTQYVRLRARLYEIVKRDEDQVIFIPMCERCVGALESMGRPTEAVDAMDIVVVV